MVPTPSRSALWPRPGWGNAALLMSSQWKAWAEISEPFSGHTVCSGRLSALQWRVRGCSGGGNEAVCFLDKFSRSYFLRIPGTGKSPRQFSLDIFTDREATFGLLFANIVFMMKMFPRLRVRSWLRISPSPDSVGQCLISAVLGSGSRNSINFSACVLDEHWSWGYSLIFSLQEVQSGLNCWIFIFSVF